MRRVTTCRDEDEDGHQGFPSWRLLKTPNWCPTCLFGCHHHHHPSLETSERANPLAHQPFPSDSFNHILNSLIKAGFNECYVHMHQTWGPASSPGRGCQPQDGDLGVPEGICA